MGQFSWITQDTNESIRNNVDDDRATAYMLDNKGNVWFEPRYEGYGEFGGKDFFELLAEMNNLTASQEELDKLLATEYYNTKEEAYTEVMRGKGIDLVYTEEVPFFSPNLYRNSGKSWQNQTPTDCPNQGWDDIK